MDKIKKLFYNLGVQTKFIVLIVIFLINLIILGSVTKILFNSSQTLTILSNEERVYVENINSGINLFYNYVISENENRLKQSKEKIREASIQSITFSNIDSLLKVMRKRQWLPFLYDIYKEGADYDIDKIDLMGSQIKMLTKINPRKLDHIQQVALDASILGNRIIEQMDDYSENPTPDKLENLQTEFEQIHYFTGQFAKDLYSLGEYLKTILYLIIITLVIILGTLVTLFSIRISKTISKPINRLADNFKRIAMGDLSSTINIDSNNEIGVMSKAFLEIQLGLQDIISHARKVAKGDYSSRLEENLEEDELSPALNRMAEKLEEAKVRTTRESRMQKGISGLDDQMRGNFTVRELSERIITYLSNYLQVEMGAVYVFDEVLEHLELTGSIGINTDEVKKIIQRGEGLVGNAAMQKSIQIIETKDKFQKIFSATGELKPDKIYLLPLHFDKRIQAVIELAPIHQFSEEKLEFINLISERVSVNLSAAVARYRIKELLDQSQQQAENLKARDKELVLKLEENQSIRDNLTRETALLNSMLKTLPDYVYFKDTESNFLRISESMVDLFSARSSQEIIGKSDFDFHPLKDAKLYFNEEQEIIKNGEGFIDEIRQGVDEKGNELWTSVTKLPMYNENGKCIGTFGISKDVTKIKKLEIEVKLQNERLKQQREELRATNEELNAQEEELRVANEELAEQTKILSESEKSLQLQQEELTVANEELEAKTNLLELQKKDILEKNRNLTKAKSELDQKAKELELASQYKSEFLANMSHELRTPLNSILILSKLLGDNKNKNLSEDQLKSVSIVYNSGRDLLDLINEILDLSKIEAGKMTYDFTEVYSEDIKNDIELNFTPVAENKNLTFKVQQNLDFPKLIYTDRQRLMQILKNLLSNAFKFTSSGGITVEMGLPAKSVKYNVAQLNNSNTYFIAVKDTGVGIPQNKVAAIFEAFQQADGSISRKFGGTGLGLSISKQLIHVLGGEIHVSSSEGVGSEFTIYLPLDKNLVGKEQKENSPVKRETEELEIPKEENLYNKIETKEENSKSIIPEFIDDDRRSNLTRIMVLIIHPEREKAKLLIDLCHAKKFNAIVASNVADGIKLSEKYSPQAIILSAELNDETVLEKLRKNKFTARIPVHTVSRIEDSLFEELEELQTPESKGLQVKSKNLESKISKEFKQVLVVEDDPVSRLAIQILFENKDIIIHEAKTGTQAFEMISAQPFDCIILDLGLPDFSGNELLEKLNANNIPVPYVIIHTAKELSAKELRKLQKYSDSIVIKGVKSDERLMDEVTLFLHQVSNKLPQKALLYANDESENLGFKGKKVLVVDDDIRNIFAMVQILEEHEIEIFEAENGEVAIDVLKNNSNIDLVLMDIMMPVMDGYDAMKIIRKTQGIENVPIITLTAKAMKEDFQKAIDSGANDFISKPVEVDKLLSLLKIWLFK